MTLMKNFKPRGPPVRKLGFYNRGGFGALWKISPQFRDRENAKVICFEALRILRTWACGETDACPFGQLDREVRILTSFLRQIER